MSESEQFARAKSRLHNGTANEVTRAHAEAVLALAYEQRTANLIAWTAGGHPTPEMRALIEERLGLG